MQYGAVARFLALSCAFAACNPAINYEPAVVAVHQTHSEKQIAAVPRPAGRPWKIGQWVLYSTGARSYQVTSLAAEDGCGLWFETDLVTDTERTGWKICMRRPEPGSREQPFDLVKVAYVAHDNDPPRVVPLEDLRASETFAAILSDLIPATWDEPGAHEDVDVPAGHFAEAVRSAEPGGTRWLHPDVPFDATVRFHATDGRDYTLIGYGEDRTASLVRHLYRYGDPGPGRGYIAIALANGVFTGHGPEGDTNGLGPVVEIGWRASPMVDVTVNSTFYFLQRASDSMASLRAYVATIGARVFPFASAHPRLIRPGLEALYLRAGLGYAELGSGNDRLANGVAGNLGLGYLVSQRRIWASFVELGDQIMWFDSDRGVRNELAVTFGIAAAF